MRWGAIKLEALRFAILGVGALIIILLLLYLWISLPNGAKCSFVEALIALILLIVASLIALDIALSLENQHEASGSILANIEKKCHLIAFDGKESILHVAISSLLTILNPIALIAATIAYIMYQYFEKEPLPNKLGDFVEWIAGVVIGSVIKQLIIFKL